MSSLIGILSVASACVFVGFDLAAARSNQTPKEVPTPVQEGRMTEQQREHSKLHRYKRGQRIVGLAKEGTADLEIQELLDTPGADPAAPRQTFAEFLAVLACQSDAVVVGLVKDKASQITADGTFLFTDYTVAVEEVVKKHRGARSGPDRPLTVTRPGGAINLHRRNIRAVDSAYLPLAVGERYVLFLKAVPATGAYMAASPAGGFGLGGRVTRTTHLPHVFEPGADVAGFLELVRGATAAPCKQLAQGVGRRTTPPGTTFAAPPMSVSRSRGWR